MSALKHPNYEKNYFFNPKKVQSWRCLLFLHNGKGIQSNSSLFALFIVEPNELLIIDEPEMNLHPAAKYR